MREAAFVFSLPSSLGGLCGFMLVEEAAVVNDTRPKVACGHRKLFFLLILKKKYMSKKRLCDGNTLKYLEFRLHLSQV